MGKGKDSAASAGRGTGTPAAGKSAAVSPTETPTTPEKDGPDNGSESPSKRIKIDIGGSPFMKKLELENDDKTKIVQYTNDWKVSGNSYMVQVINMSDAHVKDFKEDKELLRAMGCYPFQPMFIQGAPKDFKVNVA